jgi:PIN domain nuclease of toxin-antitoxin system
MSEPHALVMDSSALLAFFQAEEGGSRVRELCRENLGRVYLHAVNAGEVYYWFRRDHGEDAAQAALEQISAMGIITREDLDPAFWQDAMQIKADARRVSLADCYFLAMTRRLGAMGVTTDHHEMDPLVPLNLCPLLFAR